jgi:hypothetical protein
MMFALLLILSLAAGAQEQPDFRYEVLRSKVWKDEPGELLITPSGIDYRSTSGKTSLEIPYVDIRELDLSDSGTIHIQTYDMLKKKLSGRRTYTFHLRHLRGVRHEESLVKYLSDKVKRPVLASYTLDTQPEFEIPAYHRHVWSGCSGTIRITPEGLQFLSTNEEHSRTWLYSEVKTFGGSDPFSFRITTLAETYTFDLKEPLPRQVYESVWQRVYDLPPRYNTQANSRPQARQ